MVNSVDRSRFTESYEELAAILESPEKDRVPVIVLANKQDLPGAASCSEISEALHMHKIARR